MSASPSSVGVAEPSLGLGLDTGAPLALDADSNARMSRLLGAYFRMVYRTVRRLGVLPDACEDAAQEVFLIVAQKIATVPCEREKQFLYGVALRVAANRRRSQASLREVSRTETLDIEPCTGPLADALVDEKRMRQVLDRVLDSIPVELRTVFVLAELEGLSGREIAALLEMPAGTVASRLRRAREVFSAAAAAAKRSFSGNGGPR